MVFQLRWEYHGETRPQLNAWLTAARRKAQVLVFAAYARRRRTRPTELLPHVRRHGRARKPTCLERDTDKRQRRSYFEDQHGGNRRDEENGELLRQCLTRWLGGANSSTVEIPPRPNPMAEQQHQNEQTDTPDKSK